MNARMETTREIDDGTRELVTATQGGLPLYNAGVAPWSDPSARDTVVAVSPCPEPGTAGPRPARSLAMTRPGGVASATQDDGTDLGEDEGFEFMKGLHRNINQYTKSGSAPTPRLSGHHYNAAHAFAENGGGSFQPRARTLDLRVTLPGHSQRRTQS